jgi:dipeptidyl aminopeptidase/acylaminoacyl peptidase
LFAAESHDVDDVILSPDGAEVVGVRYYDHYRVDHYFDAKHETRAALVKQSFPQYETAIVSSDDSDNRLMVAAQKDNSPPKYFWIDLEKKSGGLWFSQYPYLEKQPLASVQPFVFEASDGMQLNGYLTLPVTGGNAPYPLVIHPHGGPQSRDYQYFDPFVQFFASRGYAVLQVNFRGSTGFSNAYERAGYREWGRRMQEDVYDAIAWVERSDDRVDTDKACIVGGSYGGYVALVAAFQRPDEFECFVSMAGVTDLVDLAATTKRGGWFEAFVNKTIGDPSDSEDREALTMASPIEHVASIKRPLLLIHGTYDTQVRVTQAAAFHKKAERSRVDVEYIELEHGTHYFDEYENRLAVFRALDRFLGKHL